MENIDIPIQSLKADEFGIEKYVNALRDFIQGSGTPMTIALQGEWGSGKSSFMRILESMLCDPSLPTSERYESIWLNTWDLFLENDYEAAVKRLVLSLINQLEGHFEKLNNDKKKEKRREMLRGYLRAFSSSALGIAKLNGEFSDKILDTLLAKNTDTELRQVKDRFESYITEEISQKDNGITNKAFLIFVDDLDRLEPKLAVTILEALKNLFDIKNCIFILAIDYEMVANGVERKYGILNLKSRDMTKDYFDKLIQVPYMIPMAQYNIKNMVMKRLREFNFFSRQYEYTRYEKMLVEIVTLATRKNPRAIKRLLNMLQLATAIEGESGDPAKGGHTGAFRTMELLLMALQLAFPEIYSLLVSNTDLDNWKRWIYVSVGNEITDMDRERYRLDKEWKEIIFLASAENETAKRSYPRVVRLLEFYEDLSRQCEMDGEDVRWALGIVNAVNIKDTQGQEVLYNNHSSKIQFRQGEYLLSKLEPSCYSRVLDVGCGNGQTTIELWKMNMDMTIDAFDISEERIADAKKAWEPHSKKPDGSDYHGQIKFYSQDAMALTKQEYYDLVFSNATLHWLQDQSGIYRKMLEALVPGGTLAVHQGSEGTYKELHAIARQAGENIGVGDKLKDWSFPAQYPSKEEMEKLLKQVGYIEINVENIEINVESAVRNESGNSNLMSDFVEDSLIHYQTAGLTDGEFEKLKEEFLRLCGGNSKVTAHRLYILARRPRKAK